MGSLAPSTRALYERNMRQLVMPAFEHLLLREITVRTVDQFIKSLAANKSYSTAKQARTVLSLALGLAVRYDALRENPMRGIAKMHKPPSQAMALSSAQVDAIRLAVRTWRRGPGIPGPPPDGQLEQIIEVMLGTSARIGVACQRVGTGWGCFLPGSWDRLGCQSWDHPARLAEAGGGSSLTRRVMSFGTEVSGYGIQGGQRG
jgi:hypothetical protein